MSNGKWNHKKIARLSMQVLLDAVMINASWLVALYTFYDMHVPKEHLSRYIRLWPALTLVTLVAFALSRMYQGLWKYAGMSEMIRIVVGTWAGTFACYIFSLIAYTFQKEPNLFLFRRTIYLFAWLILLVLVAGQRFSSRLLMQIGAGKRAKDVPTRRVLVVGAGWAGATLIREMNARGYRDGMPVAVVDDDPAKAGTRLGNVPVLLGVENIAQYAEKYRADEIDIAIPSATGAVMQRIMKACEPTGCKLRMVPGLQEVDGAGGIGKLRDVNIADLLCRDEVKLDMDSIRDYLTGKTVLVTGGGGSIGSELCRQIANFAPKRLVVFDIYENNAYELENELRAAHPGKFDLTVLIGSIRDEARLDKVFQTYKPDVVFHAAAHKHVPLMEDSPAEAVKNNVFGTLNVARCCDRNHVSRMVQISTDKAVNPTNVMGATKRVTELIMQYMARHSDTKFMAVRFGNVLGSNGSVIPLFKKQIERGGPVTVTDPDITRYFMTIPEASQLVLQAGAIGESGNIYVLDMGTPVKILDLARNLIQLAGYAPDRDIKIEFCGLRPGEKLYEELAMTEESEQVDKTCHDKIMVMHPLAFDDEAFLANLETLKKTAQERPEAIRAPLCALVPTFRRPDAKKAG